MLRVVIPARIGSARLPDKMIQRIGKKMLVEHALDRVLGAAQPGQVWLASDSDIIVAAAYQRCHGTFTSANCRSGTDRCAEVADICDWPDRDVVVNVQADMPFLKPMHLKAFLTAAEKGGDWDVLTAFSELPFVEVRMPPSFERRKVLSHVGLYAYKRDALRRFASLPSSAGELEMKLEQMRAVENGMNIAYHALPEMPFEVNYPADLAAAQFIAECVQ